jgi:hypothetical protein
MNNPQIVGVSRNNNNFNTIQANRRSSNVFKSQYIEDNLHLPTIGGGVANPYDLRS